MLEYLQEQLISIYCPALDDTVSLPMCRQCLDYIEDFNCLYGIQQTKASYQNSSVNHVNREGNSSC